MSLFCGTLTVFSVVGDFGVCTCIAGSFGSTYPFYDFVGLYSDVPYIWAWESWDQLHKFLDACSYPRSLPLDLCVHEAGLD